MIKDIKMIATDLDGTLLQTRGVITEKTRNAIEKAIASGIQFVPISGRPYNSLPDALFDIKGIEYCSTSNGAVAQKFETGDRIYSVLLPARSARAIVRCLGNYYRDGEIAYEAFIDGVPYAAAEYVMDPSRFGVPDTVIEYIKRERLPVPYIIDFIYENAEKLDSIAIILKNPALQGMIWRHLEREVPDIYVTAAVDYRVEMSAKDTGKDIALKKIADELNIGLENVLVFGDGENDAPMLKCAGWGVAVENATDNCKAAADEVIGRYDSEAVADYILSVL